MTNPGASGGTKAWWIADTAETRDWLRTYARDVLLDRFRQKAIYLKFVKPVEQLIVTDEEVRSDP